MMAAREHWDAVYGAKSEREVSWYQARPEISLALIERYAPDRAAAILDVGGGASTLIDALLAGGYSDLTVLDVSAAAFARAQARLGERASSVSWIVADMTEWQPSRIWEVWHDRAAFHFLTESRAQDAYIAALTAATREGSVAIIATFALDGPERCSGLPVQRYNAVTLATRLGPSFALVEEAAERHVTPGGAAQNFTYAVLRRSA